MSTVGPTVTAPFTPILTVGWDRPRVEKNVSYVVGTFEITERTLRNWVARGCPQAVGGARPRYYLADVLTWSSYFSYLTMRFQRYREPIPAHVSFDAALDWRLQREYEIHPHTCNAYVVVPLSHNDGYRARQLEIACRGIPEEPYELEDAA